MALLTLKDIGKIYVSEGNVAVGIRGVNLSFDRGEFVAITGKSGSGKSTLLNVISGMDSYEEGELLIEGQTTSHFLQPEWEEYREKYISFIFQDYNIIESFTVLQNVELALMHIEDKKERRARAMELIRRVGLESHVKQKGSKLSGGQKQRTVIARALAKDSPIILADEPTGNLDSTTSKEIIELLREVSKDKLLIVVTHNFEQVEAYATRHVRIFDGAVESDHTIKDSAIRGKNPSPQKPTKQDKKKEAKQHIKNGLTLGKTIFTAKPRLSIFLCFLMLIGTMGIFLVTSLCGEAGELFNPHYMFNHIDGRLVLTKQSGEIFTDEELQKLVEKYGAEDYLHVDKLLDEGVMNSIVIPCSEDEREWKYPMANSVYGKDYGDNIIGRYPEAVNEVFLYLPISYQPALGEDTLTTSEILIGRATYHLVGVKYYYDNNLTPECLFTEEGFRTATAIHFLRDFSNQNYTLFVTNKDDGSETYFDLYDMTPSFDMPADKIYIDSARYQSHIKGNSNVSTTVDYHATYHKFNYNYGESSKAYNFDRTFTDADITSTKPEINTFGNWYDTNDGIIISDELLCEIAENVLTNSYVQASLFFSSDRAAHDAAEKLQDEGYIAVPSDTTYEPDAGTVISTILAAVMMAFVWGLAIVFLAFFINLCSSRTLGAFKGDMAIMRSMGIPVKVIRLGMYVRMLISLIPAFILVVLTAVLIFTSPKFNEFFVYLYAWQYALIFVGMIALTVRTTYKQIRKLFGESVKKSLKGGNAE